LRDRSLRRLHSGILEGRRAFGNVLKYLLMGTSSNFGNMFSMAAASLALPFLPMLPMQILLNNLLYDLAQTPIPADRVDHHFLRRPQRWDVHFLRRFMLRVGPISSIFDLLTFWVLLQVFHAGEEAFHTGWFIESLATQTLVLLVIRTAGRPWLDRPAPVLAWPVVGVVLLGAILPWLPVAGLLGFVPMPFSFYAYVAVVVAVYLLLVEWAKRRVYRQLESHMLTSG
jgi:Mg2+-importing ATPase